MAAAATAEAEDKDNEDEDDEEDEDDDGVPPLLCIPAWLLLMLPPALLELRDRDERRPMVDIGGGGGRAMGGWIIIGSISRGFRLLAREKQGARSS